MKFLVEVEYPDGQRQENEWTLEQLSKPNGDQPFIVWFLQTLEEQGVAKVRIETIETPDGYPADYYTRTGP